MLPVVSGFRCQERLHYNLIRLHADWDDGSQRVFRRLQFLWFPFLDYGYISGTGVENEQVVLALRKGERVGMCADGKNGNYASEIDVVNGNIVCAKIRDIETGIVERYNGPHRLGTDQQTAQNFVGSGFNNRNAVGAEVTGHKFAAIGLEDEADGRPTHIEQGQQLVPLQVNAGHLARR